MRTVEERMSNMTYIKFIILLSVGEVGYIVGYTNWSTYPPSHLPPCQLSSKATPTSIRLASLG